MTSVAVLTCAVESRKQRTSALCASTPYVFLALLGILAIYSSMSVYAPWEPSIEVSHETERPRAIAVTASYMPAVSDEGISVREMLSPKEPGSAVERLRPPLHLMLAGTSQPISSLLEALSDADLQLLKSNGGHCTSPIYRAAWSEASTYRIDPVWVFAVIEAESSCRADAVSKAGALGLMQLVPGSGARDAYRLAYGKRMPLTESLLRDPKENIRLGVAYLHGLNQHFGKIISVRARWLLTVAAYNCGTEFISAHLPAASIHWEAAEAQRWIALRAPHQTLEYVTHVQASESRFESAIKSRRSLTVAIATQELLP